MPPKYTIDVGIIEQTAQISGLSLVVYLLYEVPEEDGLLPQRIVNEAFREEDHAMGKVMLWQPGYHALLLHVRAACDVDNQITQVLPVPAYQYITSNELLILTACGGISVARTWTLTHIRSEAVTTDLTTSTAPGRTLGSLPMIDTLAANDPSMLKTTHSMPRGNTVR